MVAWLTASRCWRARSRFRCTEVLRRCAESLFPLALHGGVKVDEYVVPSTSI